MAKAKKQKPKLTAEQKKARKLKSDHIRLIRSTFRNAGFDRIPEIAGKEISFDHQAGEFDDAFLLENLLLLVEYTTHDSSYVTDHLKKKKILFSKIQANPKGFLAYLKSALSGLTEKLGDLYHDDRWIIRIIYCSRNTFDASIKDVVTEPEYFDYPIARYFDKITSTIKLSAQPELLAFLNVSYGEIGLAGKFPNPGSTDPYKGSILAEEASGFPKGYKVVSFYADAGSLLQRAFVLRRDGWRGSFEAYQRMLLPSKLESIRAKLRSNQQVAINNIIATLPSDVKPLKDGNTLDVSKLTKTEPVEITLPARANSVGLVDGQHRLYSYYRMKHDDPTIAKLRDQQNLLVTGVIYPEGIPDGERERFEASLFLSINSNQTAAAPGLRQEIEVLLDPYSHVAIARQVIKKLAAKGPLAGHVETYFFDKGKLKTSSIVSYGLVPLIKLSGADSLFKIFEHPEKDELIRQNSLSALADYIQFCSSAIEVFLSAVKANVSREAWSTERTQPGRLIAVTYINAFLITMRFLIENNRSISFEYLKDKLGGIGAFNFKAFHSSQYNRMAEELYKNHFSN